MAFTTKSGYVRVDIFKPSGKWYHTAAVDMSEHYRDDDIHNALYLACSEEHLKGLSGQWGLTTGPRSKLEEGWLLVCLEPYHEHSYPIALNCVPSL